MKKLLVLIAIGLLILAACDKKPTKPEMITVKYDVTGFIDGFVTYENKDGGSEQHDFSGAWNYAFNAVKGTWVYVSGTITSEGTGTLTLKIYKNGSVWKTATASGLFSSASLSGNI